MSGRLNGVDPNAAPLPVDARATAPPHALVICHFLPLRLSQVWTCNGSGLPCAEAIIGSLSHFFFFFERFSLLVSYFGPGQTV